MSHCPYCSTDLYESGLVVECLDCETPHHQDCWDENKKCTTYSCGSTMGIETDKYMQRPTDLVGVESKEVVASNSLEGLLSKIPSKQDIEKGIRKLEHNLQQPASYVARGMGAGIAGLGIAGSLLFMAAGYSAFEASIPTDIDKLIETAAWSLFTLSGVGGVGLWGKMGYECIKGDKKPDIQLIEDRR